MLNVTKKYKLYEYALRRKPRNKYSKDFEYNLTQEDMSLRIT